MSEAGRVIAGSARGTRLLAPGEGTRPMGDRVKQTLFAILEPKLPGAKVLDLFAGSGAGGIEALSRGAARAVFVERDQTAVRSIGENLARARVADRGMVHKADAIAYLRDRAAAEGPVGVVMVDPPYAETALMETALARRRDPPPRTRRAGVNGDPTSPPGPPPRRDPDLRCDRCGEAFLADSATRVDRAVSIREEPALRGNGLDVLPPGG